MVSKGREVRWGTWAEAKSSPPGAAHRGGPETWTLFKKGTRPKCESLVLSPLTKLRLDV